MVPVKVAVQVSIQGDGIVLILPQDDAILVPAARFDCKLYISDFHVISGNKASGFKAFFWVLGLDGSQEFAADQ